MFDQTQSDTVRHQSPSPRGVLLDGKTGPSRDGQTLDAVSPIGGADATVPMGGVGQPGDGHDKSLHAFDKYVDLKTAWIKL